MPTLSPLSGPRSAPRRAITIRSYAELDQYVQAFAEGVFNLLIVIGRPGTGKSQVFRGAVSPAASWIDGNASAFGLYCELYRHCDEPVVIDDVDGLYRDHSGVRLLKSLCQTDPVKQVAWHTNAATLDRDAIPRVFHTRTRVAIIANDWRTLNANVAAIEDRGHVIIFEPSPAELHRQASRWFTDQAVFDFIGQWLPLVPDVSLRDYHRGRELRQSAKGTQTRQDKLLEQWHIDPRTIAVAQLKADPLVPH